MKIRFHTMAGSMHSWPFSIQAIARAMKKIGGHELHIKSTNDLEYFPDDLKDLLLPGYHGTFFKNPEDQTEKSPADYWDGQKIITVNPNNPLPEIPDNNLYDLEFSYTVFLQHPRRYMPQSRARANIWNFESSILPPGWNYYHQPVDYILPSSQFSYDIFADNGIPKDKMLVVPHGVDTSKFNSDIPPYQLKTKKKVKFLHNAIPHHRKLHERVIKAYLDTFTGDDDVCLVMKTKFLTPDPKKPFEIDIRQLLTEAFKGRENPPEIEIVNAFVPDIGALYNACDAVVSMSSTEGFWLPGLEALACGKLIIAPRHGGQLDFLNDENSLLIDTGEMKAPVSMQYWAYNPDAIVGDPSIKHFSELMRRAYENIEAEKARIIESAKKTVNTFTWERAAQMILDLPIPKQSKRIYNRRRVLYIIPYDMLGGGEVWVRENIKKLDKNIYEPHVVCLNTTPKHEEMFGSISKCTGLQRVDIREELKCFIESGDFALVHFYNSFGVYDYLKYIWNHGWRCRIVETVHSDLNWHGSMMKVAKRDPIVTMIMAVSKTMKNKLEKFGNKNVAYLPQPIDWDKFKGERNKDALKELNIPDRFTVGYVGRISAEKNLATFIRCSQNLPEINFVVTGNKEELEQVLNTKLNNLNNLYFTGYRKDVERFYSAFDALMLPSIMEGLPLVILEAMSMGTPVIASNVGAIPEVVVEGKTGFLMKNPNDVMSCIKAIQQLQDKEMWNKISNNCREQIELYKQNKFDINYFYNLLFRE